jgi:hypothetical protein
MGSYSPETRKQETRANNAPPQLGTAGLAVVGLRQRRRERGAKGRADVVAVLAGW